MRKDPIVEKVLKVRAEIMKGCGNDLHRLFERLRAWDLRHPERLADPKRIGKSKIRAKSEQQPQPMIDALWKDPIVEEIRLRAAAFADEGGGDLAKIARRFRNGAAASAKSFSGRIK